MKVSASFVVDADPAAVWASVLSNETVGAWVPGGQRVVWIDARRLEASVEQSLIGFKVLVDAVLEVVERTPPSRLRMRGHGQDGITASSVDFDVELHLSPAAPGGTLVEYETDARLAGTLASIGEFILRSRAREIHRQLAAGVKRALEG